MKRSKDYDYIDAFKKIRINQICKELFLDSSNLHAHRMDVRHVHRIRVELERQINELGKSKNVRKIRSKKKRLKRKYEKRKNIE